MKYKKVNPNMSSEIKILYQIHGIKGKQLLNLFPNVSKANVYKHARKPIGETIQMTESQILDVPEKYVMQ